MECIYLNNDPTNLTEENAHFCITGGKLNIVL